MTKRRHQSQILKILATIGGFGLIGSLFFAYTGRPAVRSWTYSSDTIRQAQPVPFVQQRVRSIGEPGRSTMHADPANSDVHSTKVLNGPEVIVTHRDSVKRPGGQCATITQTAENLLIALCADFTGFTYNLLDPLTLRTLATYKLDARPSFAEALIKGDMSIVMNDTSGGAYYFLDAQERIVLADSRQHIMRVAHRKVGERYEFYLDGEWDLSSHTSMDCFSWTQWSSSDCDPIVSVAADREYKIWWTTKNGRVGTLDPDNGTVWATQFDGEQIQNGMAVDTDAVYVMTNRALYAFGTATDSNPTVAWRQEYDYGSRQKPGTVMDGSGTTPTLLKDGMLAFADNADDRINVVVIDRTLKQRENRVLCSEPIFASGASATENSVIGVGHSVVIENNYGYSNAFYQKDFSPVPGGVTRVDVVPDGDGYRCKTVWTSDVVAPSSVPKLSSQSGLVFVYTVDKDGPMNAEDAKWSITAIDFATGTVAYSLPTGVGPDFDNNYAPIVIGHDGIIYSGVFSGLVSFRDTP